MKTATAIRAVATLVTRGFYRTKRTGRLRAILLWAQKAEIPLSFYRCADEGVLVEADCPKDTLKAWDLDPAEINRRFLTFRYSKSETEAIDRQVDALLR